MKFIFSLNLKGLFKEKKEKKSQIEDYLSSIKIQMLSYSFFETLFYYFFVVIKLDMFLFNCNRNCLTTQQFISKKIFNFLCFSCWEDCEEENPTFKSPTINYRSQFIYLLESKISWEGSALLGNRLHSPPSKCYFPITYITTRDL